MSYSHQFNMLYDFIEKLQRKPERVKRRILAGLTVLAAVLLLGGWLYTVKDKVNLESKTEIQSPPVSEGGPPGPLATLKNGLALVLTDAKDKLGELLKASKTTSNQRKIYQLPDNK